VIQRPTEENEWQQPKGIVLPMPPLLLLRSDPLDVQAASYFALSASIVNLSIISMMNPPTASFNSILTHFFDTYKKRGGLVKYFLFWKVVGVTEGTILTPPVRENHPQSGL